MKGRNKTINKTKIEIQSIQLQKEYKRRIRVDRKWGRIIKNRRMTEMERDWKNVKVLKFR